MARFSDRDVLSRRDALRLGAAGVVGFSLSGWLEVLANNTATDPKRRRACILLWMNGGPSTIDLFDLKPGQENGGPFKEIATAVPGIKIGEHLPGLAKHTDRLAIVRSMATKEADHGRATFHMRTGYQPTGPIQYPPLGSLVAKELGSEASALPNFVSVAPSVFSNPGAYGSGFLGPRFAPLMVGENARGFQGDVGQALRVRDLQEPNDVTRGQADARLDLLQGLERDFSATRPGLPARSHATAYDRAVRLMRSDAAKAFQVEEESAKTRDAYGRNLFGQGCLLARRLVERGVPFVEVTLDGWDTHQDNFTAVRRLCGTLDGAWSALLADLKERGLLDTTLVVWMGEFGRTPRIAKERTGRDHWPNSWATVLGGGGVQGGQVIGKTSADGTTVEQRPVSVGDLLATVTQALGIDPSKQNLSNVGRPIRIVDKAATPIKEVLA